MDTLSYKTISANKATVKKEWVVVDATDQILGRMGSKVAKLLRGKYKPEFTPHVDCEWRREVNPQGCEGYAPQDKAGRKDSEQSLHLRRWRASARGSATQGN